MKNKSAPPALPILPHLGNISAQQFLDEYWQKKPLLIRNAFPKGFAPLTNKEILTLAGYDEAESRLVLLLDKSWRIEHGPFEPGEFQTLKKNKDARWTVLIQDTQHFSYEAHALLRHFNFLPEARIDDLMVSYAVKGGGVGPHFDSYDVFLLQGCGKRRWQISSQSDLTLKPDMPLKILKHFRAEEEWVLEEGDMLYLPPSYAHNGVAETDDCVTWSIGFRAPAYQELLEAWLDHLRDNLKAEGRYTDPNRMATDARNVNEIDAQLRDAFSSALSNAIEPSLTKAALEQFIGGYLSQPKSHISFDPPEKMLTHAAFCKRAMAKGITLDLRTRMLSVGNTFYVNGDDFTAAASDRMFFTQLASQRELTSESIKSASSKAFEELYRQWARGYWHLINSA